MPLKLLFTPSPVQNLEVLSVLCAIALTLQTPASQSSGAAELYNKVLPSVMNLSVTKADGTYTGTAFLIDTKGVAATAWHVVSKAISASAKFSDGQEFEISGVIDKDERRDIALIKVKVAGRPTLDVATSDPAVGSKAYVIGSPEGLDFSITEGLVSQVRTLDNKKVIQFSCAASPGNSGGPLVDENGKVLGVVSFQLVEGQNLNFAVPGSVLAGLDSTLPTQPWGSVKASRASTSTTVFDIEKFGVPVWDGTRLSRHTGDSNWWKTLLLYKEGAPVIPENAVMGVIGYIYGTSKTDMRAVPLQQVSLLRKYIREFMQNGSVKELPDGRFSLKCVRFVAGGSVFSDRPIPVTFVKKGSGFMTRAHWSVDFKLDYDMVRSIDKTQMQSFLDWIDLWSGLLKDNGLDIDSLSD